MKAIEVKSLLKQQNIPMVVVNKEVKAFGDGWSRIREYEFKTDKIVILDISTYGASTHMQMRYTDGVTENWVVVPPTFLLKHPTKRMADALKKKLDEFNLKNLAHNLGYAGSIGADPEIFVEDKDGEIIPAFDFLGSKEKPTLSTVKESYGNNNIYWDGFQAEFDTYAGTCMGWVGDSIRHGLKGLYDAMKAHNPTAKLSTKTVFDIPLPLLRKSAPEHVAFGCNPSLNIYGMDGLKAAGTDVFYRSAGGHVHLGMSKKSDETVSKIVKALDAILGVACVSMFAKYDDPRRRQMYGLAGEYRLPKHGIEYRALSNAWLFHPLIMNIVFDLARSVSAFGEKGHMKHWDATEEETIKAINECDVKLARKILRRNKAIFKIILNARYHDKHYMELAYKAITKGMDEVVKDASDFETNWNLKGTWITHCDGPGKNISRAVLNKKDFAGKY